MIILGLGSNLGDREGNLRLAIAAIEARLLINTRASAIITSPALMPENAPLSWDIDFLNIALGGELKNPISPFEFLAEIKNIEDELGRKPAERWAPRVIDIDILAWDDLLVETPELQIPHIGLCERDFARIPFLQLAPNWVHPKTKQKL